MWRTVFIYGALLAGGAFGLQWLQYKILVRTHPAEVYFALFALACMGLGAWLAMRLRRPKARVAVDASASERLKLSGRELEVLTLLAGGNSNKEIARRLDVSPNTVKTHVARLYEKLGARNRAEAVMAALRLGLTGRAAAGDLAVGAP